MGIFSTKNSSGGFLRRNGARIEAFSIITTSLLFLVFWGSGAEGQGPFFEVFLSDQIVERSLSLGALVHPTGVQFEDINAIAGIGSGFGGPEQPRVTDVVPTIQESALLAFSPPSDDYLEDLEERRSQVITYTVQEGDALSLIASDFGVSVTSILWANKLSDANSISPGQELRVPPVTGVVHRVKRGETVDRIARTYSANAEEIIAFNSLPKSGALIEDTELIVPGGVLRVSPSNTPTGTVRRNFSYLPNLGDYLGIPTTGYNWGRIHGRNGVDVANACGTAIFAAADGVVTVSDSDIWNGGFGRHLKIRHPNGVETLYAHASRLLVSVGEPVARGQEVAVMGTTGRSTGCHLHFEVHGAQNPLAKY